MDRFGWQRMAAVMACASLVSAAACGGNNGDATDTATSGGDVARADSGATAAAAAAPGTAASTAPGASGSGSMSITGGDPEIIQVLAVVDQAEVQDGQMAQRQARNAQVKSFARELVASHTKMLQQDRQLAKSNNVTLPTSSGTSGSTTGANSKDTGTAATPTVGAAGGATGVAGQLQQAHMQMMQQVRSAQGAAFDSAFVNAQVMSHQQVLDMLQRAQSQAQNSEVKQHLTAAVQGVTSHLERAQKLQQSLASGGSGMSGDSTSKTKGDTGRRGS